MVDLEIYKRDVEKIRRFACEHGVTEVEADEIFKNCFHILEKRRKKCGLFRWIRIVSTIFVLTVVLLVTLDWKFLGTTVMRNLQNSIYPGLKIVRRIAVPIIERYPSLSELYDEWCLLENPYFYVNDMDCWPCSVVRSVPDLSGHHVSRSFNPGIPYTKSENLSEVRFEDLQQLFWKNSNMFEKDAGRIYSNNVTNRHIKDVMTNGMTLHLSENSNGHVTWRFNRMKPGRILRKLFPKPVDAPNWWEQSMEKFIFLDQPKSPPYSLPNPECSNVVIRCTAGARFIKMVASPECTSSCKSFTIMLSSGNTLWYNWWYWRPVSLPTLNSTSITINYLTSFC